MKDTTKKHAYLIMVHEWSEVLETLLLCIDDDRNDIYIHVDAKVSFPNEKAFAVVKRSPLFFVHRIRCAWGG